MTTLSLALTLGVALAGCGGDGGDGSGGEDAETVIERFLSLGQEPGSTIDVTVGGVPPGLPSGLPEYPGSSLLGSTASESHGQKGYTVLRETDDSPDQVLLYYEEALEEDPWQVLLSTAIEGFAALQFSKIDDANFLGGVIVQEAGEGRSAILLSVQTASGETAEAEPFEPEASKPLPRGFPVEIPLYPDMIVTETAWARSPGATDFQIAFINKDTPEDVLNFYRDELTTRGWTVTDRADQGAGAGLSFESTALGGTWNGSLIAAAFDKDSSYSQTRLQLRISSQTEQSPSQSTPTP